MTYDIERQLYGSPTQAVSNETPVDLSCRRRNSLSTSSGSSSDSEKPAREPQPSTSTVIGHHTEANNNDSQSLNMYHLYRERREEDKNTDQVRTARVHLADQQYEPSSFPSSSQERKTTYDMRTFSLSPPSESSPAKMTKYPPMFEHLRLPVSELPMYSRFPMLPMGCGMPVPVTVPVPLPTSGVLPSIVPYTQQANVPPSQSTTCRTEQEPTHVSPPGEECKKAPRPFKAYPKDPMAITGLGPDILFDEEQQQAYQEFRSRMLVSVRQTTEGTNTKMRRTTKSPSVPTSTVDDKDATYWERRRKNNEAAKRSRDARRAKEDEIAIRAAFLEKGCLRLKYENARLKEENEKLTKIVYGSK